ncbi:MAG: 50S ribosomal protein L5 [Candidatus Omnitrophota bacterium]
MVPRLRERYKNEIAPRIQEQFGIKNKNAVPRLEKIVINMGVGEALSDIKILDRCMEELALLSGQRPIIRRSKKAISNFKLRVGQPVGCKVTLRRDRMYEFLDRLINVALPRIRDFRGLSTGSFDKNYNYSFGISEQIIFPEIDYDKLVQTQGMDINFVIGNAKSKEEAVQLLKLFGMPFQVRPELNP